MLEPNEDASEEDKVLIAYMNEHHEIDMAMRVVAGNGIVNNICAAFRAGAEWQRSQALRSSPERQKAMDMGGYPLPGGGWSE